MKEKIITQHNIWLSKNQRELEMARRKKIIESLLDFVNPTGSLSVDHEEWVVFITSCDFRAI